MELHIGWPEGLLLAFMFLNLSINAIKHGKPPSFDPNHSFPVSFTRWLMILTLLFLGGFFA